MILASSVEHGSLPVDIDIVETESVAQKELCTLLLAFIVHKITFPADVEEDCLVVEVFKAVVSPVADKELEQFERNVITSAEGSEIQSRLLEFRI